MGEAHPGNSGPGKKQGQADPNNPNKQKRQTLTSPRPHTGSVTVNDDVRRTLPLRELMSPLLIFIFICYPSWSAVEKERKKNNTVYVLHFIGLNSSIKDCPLSVGIMTHFLAASSKRNKAALSAITSLLLKEH